MSNAFKLPIKNEELVKKKNSTNEVTRLDLTRIEDFFSLTSSKQFPTTHK
jgi:hypothetical protein